MREFSVKAVTPYGRLFLTSTMRHLFHIRVYARPDFLFRYFVIADNNINIFADLKELVVSSFVDRRFGNQILNRCPLAHG